MVYGCTRAVPANLHLSHCSVAHRCAAHPRRSALPNPQRGKASARGDRSLPTCRVVRPSPGPGGAAERHVGAVDAAIGPPVRDRRAAVPIPLAASSRTPRTPGDGTAATQENPSHVTGPQCAGRRPPDYGTYRAAHNDTVPGHLAAAPRRFSPPLRRAVTRRWLRISPDARVLSAFVELPPTWRLSRPSDGTSTDRSSWVGGE